MHRDSVIDPCRSSECASLARDITSLKLPWEDISFGTMSEANAGARETVGRSHFRGCFVTSLTSPPCKADKVKASSKQENK